jgi:hypothetical protein
MNNANGVIIRPYIAAVPIPPGSAVLNNGDNKVDLTGGTDFIGVYPFEANETKAAGETLGIAVAGVVKVRLSSPVTAGKRAVHVGGSVAVMGTAAGKYTTIGGFLESGATGEYVDMLICRDQITV